MKETSFEIAIKNLEEAVARLESGELSLEESLACFEQGVRNLKDCRQSLRAMETRVETLLRDKDGDLVATPFSE